MGAAARAGNSQKRSHRWRTRRCSGAWIATICVTCEICRRAAPGQVGQRELQYQLRRPGNRQKGLRTRVWPGGVAAVCSQLWRSYSDGKRPGCVSVVLLPRKVLETNVGRGLQRSPDCASGTKALSLSWKHEVARDAASHLNAPTRQQPSFVGREGLVTLL